MKNLGIHLLILVLLVSTHCDEDKAGSSSAAPEITHLNIYSGIAGDTLIIYGRRFSADPSLLEVDFNNQRVSKDDFYKVSEEMIKTLIPYSFPDSTMTIKVSVRGQT